MKSCHYYSWMLQSLLHKLDLDRMKRCGVLDAVLLHRVLLIVALLYRGHFQARLQYICVSTPTSLSGKGSLSTSVLHTKILIQKTRSQVHS